MVYEKLYCFRIVAFLTVHVINLVFLNVLKKLLQPLSKTGSFPVSLFRVCCFAGVIISCLDLLTCLSWPVQTDTSHKILTVHPRWRSQTRIRTVRNYHKGAPTGVFKIFWIRTLAQRAKLCLSGTLLHFWPFSSWKDLRNACSLIRI